MSLEQLYKQFDEIRKQIWEAAEKELVPGTHVFWVHGQSVQEGEVIQLIGGWWSPGIRVKNIYTGNTVDLDLRRLILT